MLQGKDVLGMEHMSVEEIELILETARYFKEYLEDKTKSIPSLKGKSFVNLFYEPSTRTRTSFEMAAKYLDAEVINFNQKISSAAKGETLKDTAVTIQMMKPDGVIIRHSTPGSAKFLADHLHTPVINAGDGTHEHPTQALLDLFTIKEKKGAIAGLNVLIAGDILHSRVARSNIWGLKKMGAKVSVVGPLTLIPDHIQHLGIDVYTDPEEAVSQADVINVLRVQLERQQKGLFPSLGEYNKFFGIKAETLKKAKKDVLIMHPGPMNRGVEIDSIVADSTRSAINEQVTNGVAVRMALLYLITGGESSSENLN